MLQINDVLNKNGLFVFDLNWFNWPQWTEDSCLLRASVCWVQCNETSNKFQWCVHAIDHDHMLQINNVSNKSGLSVFCVFFSETDATVTARRGHLLVNDLKVVGCRAMKQVLKMCAGKWSWSHAAQKWSLFLSETDATSSEIEAVVCSSVRMRWLAKCYQWC